MFVQSVSQSLIKHVFPATDEEFRNQHDGFERGGYEDYDGYVRRVIDETNEYLMDTFSDEPETPHLVITTNENGEWGRWDNPDSTDDADTVLADSSVIASADTVFVEQRQMRDKLEWPVRNGEVDRRGSDVLSGFSGQAMNDPDPDDSSELVRNIVAGQFIDAVSGTPEGENRGSGWEQGSFNNQIELTGGTTLIGTNDPATNPETAPNYYMHELGHVLGGIHPDSSAEKEEFEVPSGKPGVMCKDSRITSLSSNNFFLQPILAAINRDERVSILTAEYYSEPSKYRMLNIDYDFKDAEDPIDNKQDQEPEGSINEARNIKGVATAASTDPPDENVDFE